MTVPNEELLQLMAETVEEYERLNNEARNLYDLLMDYPFFTSSERAEHYRHLGALHIRIAGIVTGLRMTEGFIRERS